MINRRLYRIKVMQALFAYFQDEYADINKEEKKLFISIDKLYELYIWQLSFLIAVFEFEKTRIEEAANKLLPTEEDLKPNTRFIDNKLIAIISENNELQKMEKQFHISWVDYEDIIRSVLTSIKESEDYAEYMRVFKNNNFNDDRNFLYKIFTGIIIESSLLKQFFEEKSIYWADDFDTISYMLSKTIKSLKSNHKPEDSLFDNGKKDADDEKEDRAFVRDLFRKTIIHSNEFMEIIAVKTSNWEVERIALMDMVLCRMALAEVTCFPSIPVKVTLNEYIEIAKMYSTPKSSVFINGVLDKLFEELKEQGKIKKTGRGLME